MRTLINGCQKPGCRVSPTITVAPVTAGEEDGDWVCVRHINWALTRHATEANQWRARVIITAWDDRRD